MQLDSMGVAIYQALYVDRTVFQWIHFTPYGVVAGRISKDHY